MRLAVTGLALALGAVAAGAQPVHYTYEKPAVSTPEGVDGSQMAELLRGRHASGRIAPTVAHDSADTAFIFPLIGNTPGANGTYFYSDGTLVNNKDQQQVLRLFFFPAGAQTCNGVPVRDVTIPPYHWYEYGDIIANLFGLNGLGSLGVIAIDSFGNYDPTAHVDATVRIYTATPGGGSASQTFESIALSDYGGSELIFGLRSDSSFRTNYGIFNYLGYTRTFDTYFDGFNNVTAQSSLTVPPCSVVFTSVPSRNFIGLLINVVPRDDGGGWYGFASSVDNISGDSWSVSARP